MTPVVERIPYNGTLSPSVVLARYLRWRCRGRPGGSMSISFRAWVVATGRFAPLRVQMLTPVSEDCECDEDDDDMEGDDMDEGDLRAEVESSSTPDVGRDGPDAALLESADKADRRAWNRWRPAVLFAGPNTQSVRGMEPATTDLASAIAARRRRID